jgi:molybdopterin-containing oxidoreductase family membrane subunit
MATDSAIAGHAQVESHAGRNPDRGHVVIRPQDVQSQLVATTEMGGSRFRTWALGLTALVLIGVIGMVIKVVQYIDDQEEWGYTAAMAAFLLTIGGGAPMVAIAPVLAKANWVRPLTRIAAAFSLVGVVSIILTVPLVFVLPPLVTEGARRRSIWFGSPDWTPHTFIFLAMGALLIAGLGLFYSAALPDFAAMRDHSTGRRQTVGKFLARGWVGTTVQWRTFRMRIGMFGTFYFLILIYTHFLFTSDFAMGVVPGWRDAIFPMYHSMSSIQGGIALVILGAWAARRFFHLENYLRVDQFWPLGRLLFASSLLWVYFFFSAFIVFWYGRNAADIAFIDLFIRGPMIWAFLPGMFMSFLVPWWWLIWNRIRTSVNGPAIGALIVLFGLLLDRMRIYVSAWSVPPEQIHEKYLQEIPHTVWPDVFDILIILGALAAVPLIFMLVTRVIPIVSIWQMQEYQLLSKPVKYIRGEGVLVGKPD